MSSISQWVLSIVGVCFISVVVDLLLLDGKTNNIIKRVVSYAIMLVVIIPIPKLLQGSADFDDLFPETGILIQDGYIYNINQSMLDAIDNDIEELLAGRGYNGAEVSISADVFSKDMQIYAIYVDLYNLVITEELANKDIKTEVTKIVMSVVEIEKEKVIIYE